MTLKGVRPVIGVAAHPPLLHPNGCPIFKGLTAVEVKTDGCSRWYGVEKAYIDATLQMVVEGFDEGFEEMAKWPLVSEYEDGADMDAPATRG
jgi:hypothetical protein